MLSIRLKYQRKQLGLSIAQVAAYLEIDSSLYSRIESGKRKATVKQIGLLADVLKFDRRKLRALWLAEEVYGQLKEYEEAKDVIDILSDAFEVYQVNREKRNKLSTPLKKIIDKIDVLKQEINEKRPLNKAQVKKLSEHFNTVYTYDSNKIEGNTLSLQETALVISKGITIGGKSMREHLEAINHAEAIDFIYELIKEDNIVSERNIRDIHSLVLRGIDKENAGRYREIEVMITGSKHIPPPSYDLDNKMKGLIDYYEDYENQLHPVIIAADMHYKLAGVHPFIDGNGRTSRLLMNLILIKNGYLLASIKGELKNRLAYYHALETAQVNHKPESFRILIAKHVKNSLEEYLKFIQ
jgi:Fic family protein